MIIFNFLLDLIMANYTIIPTYFFLVNIYKIPLRYCLIIIFIALFIDIFITRSILNIIVLPILYFSLRNKKNKNKLSNTIIINSLIYLIYVGILYLYFNYTNINFIYIIKYLLLNYPVYLIYVLISNKFYLKS